jgi:hypothetical protein
MVREVSMFKQNSSVQTTLIFQESPRQVCLEQFYKWVNLNNLMQKGICMPPYRKIGDI